MKIVHLSLSIALGIAGVSMSSAGATGCVSPQWTTPDAAAAAFAHVAPAVSGERWLGGDGGWTVVHPVTCSRLHIFGDSAVLDSIGRRIMPSGNAILQTTSGLRYIPGPMIPDDADGAKWWPGPSIYENGRLYVFVSHIRPLATGGWEELGHNLAEFTWDGSLSLSLYSIIEIPSALGITWGTGVLRHGTQIYIYGTYHEKGWFGRRVYVARVPAGQLANETAWRYWDGTDYTSNAPKSVISEFGGPDSAFGVYTAASQFRLVSKKDGAFGDTVQRWSSFHPEGPWTTTALFPMPWTDADQTYLPIAHGDMRYANGQIPISISHGRGGASLSDMWDHPERFRNSWHGATP